MLTTFLSLLPHNRLFTYLLLFVGLFLFSSSDLTADTLDLKNGNSFKGIITKETNDSIELDIGSGTLTFSKQIINKIHRSSSDELDILREKMELKKEELKAKDQEFAEAREKRFKEYEKWTRESAIKKASTDSAADEIKLLKVENSKDFMVEVIINGSVKATLILDTGSYDIVLTRRIGEALGIDFSDTKKNVRSIRLTGKERLTKVVHLDSIRIQNIEEKDLMAEVLFEDVDTLGLKDGLLGLAFLDRFDCIIDLKGMKMRLQKKLK